MKNLVVSSWDALMHSRHNPLRHLDLASQHCLMQVPGWMSSMVFSLSFLSKFQFGVVWAAHLLIVGGAAMTVALFRQSEKQQKSLIYAPVSQRAATCSGVRAEVGQRGLTHWASAVRGGTDHRLRLRQWWPQRIRRASM